ncbi:MAG: ABC transporter permease [Terriglobales bacterium]
MLRDLLIEAYNAMRYNRRRSALTMLGMAWGIATVCMLLAYGQGFGRAAANIFATFGTKMMFVDPGRTSMQAGGDKAGTQVRLTLDDIDLLSTNVPQITHISPSNGKTVTVQYENRSFDFNIVGEYPLTYNIRALNMDQGRFYNGQDEAQRARVTVIGPEAKEKLFSGRNAIGEHIRIDGQSFEVIGVCSPKMQGGDDDNINRLIFVPYSTLGDIMDTHYLGSLLFNYETNDYEQVEQSVRNVIADQHRYNPADRRALRVFNVMVQIHQFQIVSIGLNILLGFIGTLTLGIGGVGLMNIMLVSVSQRTREIGVEKALGARRSHIFVQFLAEALAITLIGGVFGVILAYGVALSVGRLTLYSAMAKHAEAGDIRLMISPMTLLVAIVILVGVGLVSGMLPAIRASRLDPIEALRYE